MTQNILSSVGYSVNNLEELHNLVPAAFSGVHHPDRTSRYSLISTIKLIEAFEKSGWNIHSAKQHGASVYSRHIIRFTNPDLGFLPLKGDKVKPHIILDNSHDGYTQAQLHMGLFRLVCSNGLVIAMPGMYTHYKFRHIGVDEKELINVISQTADQYKTLGSHIQNMQEIVLNSDQKEAFAIKAIALREPKYVNSETGEINFKEIVRYTNPKELFVPVRPQDENDNLWTVFNVIQERTIKGMYERKSKTGRKSSPRVLTNAARNLKFNKDLWAVAEEFLPADGISLS